MIWAFRNLYKLVFKNNDGLLNSLLIDFPLNIGLGQTEVKTYLAGPSLLSVIVVSLRRASFFKMPIFFKASMNHKMFMCQKRIILINKFPPFHFPPFISRLLLLAFRLHHSVLSHVMLLIYFLFAQFSAKRDIFFLQKRLPSFKWLSFLNEKKQSKNWHLIQSVHQILLKFVNLKQNQTKSSQQNYRKIVK